MQYQKALVCVMEHHHTTVQELSRRMGSDPRWVTEVTTNSEWRPKLDTIFRICYTLKFDVIEFVNYAEFGRFNSDQKTLVEFGRLPNTSYQFGVRMSGLMNLILDIRPEHIAKALRSFRIERNLTQRKLEQITPFSVNTICH